MRARFLWERKGVELTKVFLPTYQTLIHLFRQMYYSDQCVLVLQYINNFHELFMAEISTTISS